MSNLPALPTFLSTNLNLNYMGLNLPANTEWNAYNIDLEPLEKVKLEVHGTVQYYYKTWTTRGSCGKRKRHYDIRHANANTSAGRCSAGIAHKGSAQPFYLFEEEIKNSKKIGDLVISKKGRLSVSYRDTTKNYGDNAGSFSLNVTVSSSVRISNYLKKIDELIVAITKPHPMKVAKILLENFPSRVVHYKKYHNEILNKIIELGYALLDDKQYHDLADWIGRWANSKVNGGNPSISRGYELRAEVAMARNSNILAAKFLALAIEYADNESLARVAYTLGKVKECQGVYFSPENIDLSSPELLSNPPYKTLKDDSKEIRIGAYDLYKWSLFLMSKTEKEKPESKDNIVKSYNTYYALARLDYLKHTTESLVNSAGYLRQCRRLTRLRMLLDKQLFSEYNFALLLNDTHRSHNNPCRGETPLVALNEASIEVNLGLAWKNKDDVKSSVPDHKFACSLNWCALDNRTLSISTKDKFAGDSSEIYEEAGKAEVIADGIDREVSQEFFTRINGNMNDGSDWVSRDKSVESIKRFVEGLVNKKYNKEGFHLVDCIQNASYLIEQTIRNFCTNFSANGVSLQNCNFNQYELKGSELFTKVIKGTNTKFIINTFRNHFGHELQTRSVMENDRLYLKKLFLKFTDNGYGVIVSPEFVKEGMKKRLDKVDVKFIENAEILTRINLIDFASELPVKNPEVSIGVGYSNLGVITKIDIVDIRGEIALPNMFKSYNWTANLRIGKSSTNANHTSNASLASAYVPFHAVDSAIQFDKTTIEDVRWALGDERYKYLWPKMIESLMKQLSNLRSDETGRINAKEDIRSLFIDFVLSPATVLPENTRSIHVRVLCALAIISEPGNSELVRETLSYKEACFEYLKKAIFEINENKISREDVLRVLRKAYVPLSLPRQGNILEFKTNADASDVSESIISILSKKEHEFTVCWLNAYCHFYHKDREVSDALYKHIEANGITEHAGILIEKRSLLADKQKESVNEPEQKLDIELYEWSDILKHIFSVLKGDGKESDDALHHLKAYLNGAGLSNWSSRLETIDMNNKAPLVISEALNTLCEIASAEISRINRVIKSDFSEAIAVDAQDLDEYISLVLKSLLRLKQAEKNEFHEGISSIEILFSCLFKLRVLSSVTGDEDGKTLVFSYNKDSLTAKYTLSEKDKTELDEATRTIKGLDEKKAIDEILQKISFPTAADLRIDEASLKDLDASQKKIEKAVKLVQQNKAEYYKGDSINLGKPFHNDIASISNENWELVMHDQPYSDCIKSLIALCDRLSARHEFDKAKEVLEEAQMTIAKLKKEDYLLISKNDRVNSKELEVQILRRNSMLMQRRDVFGEFISKAPPRRLDVVLGEFSQYFLQHNNYMDDSKKASLLSDQRQMSNMKLEIEESATEFDIQESTYAVEKHNRILSETSSQISQLHSERTEQFEEVAKGEAKYQRAKQKSEQALSSIGEIVATAASAYLPVTAVANGLVTPETIKNITQGVETYKSIENGEDPINAVLSNFGEDILDATFGSFGNSFAEEIIQDTAEKTFKNYRETGEFDLKGAAENSIRGAAEAEMRSLGESIYKEHLSGLAEQLDSTLLQAEATGLEYLKKAEKSWNKTKKDLKTGLDNVVFKKVENIGEDFNELIAKYGSEVERQLKHPISQAAAALDQFELTVKGKKSLATIAINNLLPKNTKAYLESLSIEEISVKNAIQIGLQLSGNANRDVSKTVNEYLGHITKRIFCPQNDEQAFFMLLMNTKKEYQLSDTLGVIADVVEKADLEIKRLNDGVKRALIEARLKKYVMDTSNTNGSVHLSKLIFNLEKNLIIPKERITAQFGIDKNQYNKSKSLISHFINGDVVKEQDFEKVAAVIRELSIVVRAVESRYSIDKKGNYDYLSTKLSSITKELQNAVVDIILDGSKTEIPTEFQRIARDLLSTDSVVDRIEEFCLKTIKEDSLIKTFEILTGKSFSLKAEKQAEEKFKDKTLTPITEAIIDIEENIDNISLFDDANGIVTKFFKGARDTVKSPFLRSAFFDQNKTIKIDKDDISEESKNKYVNMTAAKALLDQRLIDNGRVAAIAKQKELNEIKKAWKDGGEAEAMPSIVPAKGEKFELNPELNMDRDAIDSLMSNSTISTAVAAISLMYPGVGMAIQAVVKINDWVNGEAEKNDAVVRIDRAQVKIKSLDNDLADSYHRKELAEIDKLVAENGVEKNTSILLQLGNMKSASMSIANKEDYLTRRRYERMWTSLGLLSHHLYILQKAFEYEFDAPLSLMFKRWPQLEKFRTLLELSPGVLTGEFSRTNVMEEIDTQMASLDDLTKVLNVVRPIIEDRRLKDSTTLSLAVDYPESWKHFQDGIVPKFRTSLSQFMGVGSLGQELRYGYKINRIYINVIPKLDAEINAREKMIDASNKFNETIKNIDSRGKDSNKDIPNVDESIKQENSLLTNSRARALGKLATLPDRFKVGLLHTGMATQINEAGGVYEIEWGPQLVDSNMGALDPEKNYQPTEGLSPITEWILLWDPEFGVNHEDILDIEIKIEFSYLRNQLNLGKTSEILIENSKLELTNVQDAINHSSKAYLEQKYIEIKRIEKSLR